MDESAKVSRRITGVQSPVIPIVAQWTAQTPGTISLGQGVVHYGPPESVFTTLADPAIQGDHTDRYGPVVGDQALLNAIEHKLLVDNGISLAAGDGKGDSGSEVVVTAGANMGFLNAILAIADVDDEIILLTPYYFNHHMAIEIAGCRVVEVPTDRDSQPVVADIAAAITDRTRAVVTISPNNPTGALYREEVLRQINSLCQQRGIFHLSDEAYEYFIYDEARHFSPGSIAGAAEHTISLFSLSKTYAMAGFRIGYQVLPKRLSVAVKKVQDTNLICPPRVCQQAALAAMQVGPEHCQQYVPELQQVRDRAIDRLQTLGERCQISRPEGAFYLFLHLDSSQDDVTLTEQLIRQHQVAVLPGSAFGASASCSLRLSFGALNGQTVIDGIDRLADGLRTLL